MIEMVKSRVRFYLPLLFKRFKSSRRRRLFHRQWVTDDGTGNTDETGVTVVAEGTGTDEAGTEVTVTGDETVEVDTDETGTGTVVLEGPQGCGQFRVT